MTEDCLQLVEQANGGDAAALRAIYTRWGKMMRQIANSIIRDEGDAHDIVIDVLLKILELPASRLPAAAAHTWLMTLAKNCACDCLKKANKIALIECADRLATYSELGDSGTNWVEYRLALEDLGQELRAILIWKLVYGFKLKEIAISMGIPEASVRRKYAAALRKARRLLAEEKS